MLPVKPSVLEGIVSTRGSRPGAKMKSDKPPVESFAETRLQTYDAVAAASLVSFEHAEDFVSL